MAGDGVELATGYVSLVIAGDEIAPGVRRALRSSEPEADRAGRRAGERYGGSFSSSLKRGAALIGFAGLGAAAAGFVKKSVDVEKQFSQSMNLIRANVAGATDQSIAKLDKLAQKLGSETVFSANEAAEAMLELAKGGFAQAEIAGGGVQASMALAATEGLDLATSATIVSNAMNAFGLEAGNAAQIADALAAGSAASSASVASLAEGLGNVGAIAKQSGLSLQDTVTALTILDANAVKGAEGGTALRSFLTALVPTTDRAKKKIGELGLSFQNADGSFRDLGDISEQLRSKLGKLSEAQRAEALQTIFGTYAKQAAAIFLDEGAKGFAKYTKEVNKSGKAQELADARSKGTAGALERLGGAVETAQLALGKALAPVLTDVANFLAEEAAPAITEFFDGMREGEGVGGDVADMLGDLVDIGKDVVDIFESIPGPVKKFGIQIAIGAAAISKLNTAIGASKLAGFVTDLKNAETRADRSARAMQGLGGAARNAAGGAGLLLLFKSTQDVSAGTEAMTRVLGGAAAGFAVGGPLGAGIGATAGMVSLLFGETKKSSEATKISTGRWQDYKDTLDGVTGATSAATRAMARQRVAPLLGTTRDAGLADREVINGIVRGGAARARVIAALDREKKALDDVVDATFKKLSADGRINAVDQSKINSARELAEARQAEIDAVLRELGATDKAVAARRREIAATTDYGKKLDALPKAKRVKVEATGIVPTLGGVARVAKAINATPKEIETLIKAAGVPFAVEEVQRFITKTDRVPPNKNTKLNVEQGTGWHLFDVLAQLGRDITVKANGPGAAGRSGGGYLRQGVAYEVGEFHRELFIPDRGGRMYPYVPTAPTASATSLAGTRLALVINGRRIEGVISEIADSRIDTFTADQGMNERAFG